MHACSTCCIVVRDGRRISHSAGFAGSGCSAWKGLPVGYERFDVKPAGLSILVPDGMRIAKPSGDVLFSAFDGGKYIEHGVTVILFQPVHVIAFACGGAESNAARARLRGMGGLSADPAHEHRRRAGRLADLDTGQDRIEELFPRTASRPSRVRESLRPWPTSERAYTQVVDTAIGGLSIMRD